MCFFKRKKRVALVLGSGGARGLAHVGVIKALVKNKIPIDMVVGASSGALIGGLFASWGKIDDLEEMARGVTLKDLAELLFEPGWGGGLVKGNKTLEYLEKLFNKGRIEDLKIPFVAVATDVNTAETVVFDHGDMAEAIRASISVPLVYSPVLLDGRLLVDGGVSSPVPVEIARDMGAEIVIAVSLDGVYFIDGNHKGKLKNFVVDVLKDSYFALRYNLAKKEIKGADIVIEPEMNYIEDFDFIAGKAAIDMGEKATENLMKKIKKLV
jgi:NTE family protein